MKKIIKVEISEDQIIYNQSGYTPEELDEKIYKQMAIDIIKNMEIDDLKKIFSMSKSSGSMIKFVVELEV